MGEAVNWPLPVCTSLLASPLARRGIVRPPTPPFLELVCSKSMHDVLGEELPSSNVYYCLCSQDSLRCTSEHPPWPKASFSFILLILRSHHHHQAFRLWGVRGTFVHYRVVLGSTILVLLVVVTVPARGKDEGRGERTGPEF